MICEDLDHCISRSRLSSRVINVERRGQVRTIVRMPAITEIKEDPLQYEHAAKGAFDKVPSEMDAVQSDTLLMHNAAPEYRNAIDNLGREYEYVCMSIVGFAHTFTLEYQERTVSPYSSQLTLTGDQAS